MKKNVLIVDDSVMAYEEMKTLLTTLDLSVIGYCRNGEEALKACRELKPDLVTMDFVMPGMDGIVTCKKLLEELPELKIILVSSIAYDEIEKNALEAGASAFVYKPVREKWLVKALADAFGQTDSEPEE